MSLATRAKSAQARATIAANIIKNTKGDFGRNMDDCFEMNDGDEVVRLLKEKARTDMALLYGMMFTHENQAGHWGEEISRSLGLSRAEVYRRYHDEVPVSRRRVGLRTRRVSSPRLSR